MEKPRRPESRREQLLTESVGNELVIYDARTHDAHHLSPTAAHVWRQADGERDVADLARALRQSIGRSLGAEGATVDDAESLELVRLALVELDRAGLLARALPNLAVLGEPISRRQMLGVTAALLPVVASIVAPTPAMAASCLGGSATANPATVIANGGPITLTIVTFGPWTATSLEGYITASGATTGTGNASVLFNVGSNSSTAARSGVITVAFAGCSVNVVINQNPAAVGPPTAVISSPNTVQVNTVVNFDGSGSQGTISSWTWDFGDTFTGSGAMTTHTYATNLLSPNSQTTLTVKLTVQGPGGGNQVTKNITVFRTY